MKPKVIEFWSYWIDERAGKVHLGIYWSSGPVRNDALCGRTHVGQACVARENALQCLTKTVGRVAFCKTCQRIALRSIHRSESLVGLNP